MTVKPEEMQSCYQDRFEYLVDELALLDLLVRRRVLAMRIRRSEWLGAAVEPQLYISHREIDHLLDLHGVPPRAVPDLEAAAKEIACRRREIEARVEVSQANGVFLGLPQLGQLFALSAFERQVLLICLAPELMRTYDLLYAYLQDDVTRKRPSVDLVLDLLCENETDKWRARGCLSDQARLLRAGILEIVDDPHSPSGASGLAQFLRLDPRILNFILGNNSLDSRLQGLVRVLEPSIQSQRMVADPGVKAKLLNLIQHLFAGQQAERTSLVFYLQGPVGVGKQALALDICRTLDTLVIYADMELLLAGQQDLRTLLSLTFREGLLLQAVLFLDHVDCLLPESQKSIKPLKQLAAVTEEYSWITFLAGQKPWARKRTFAHAVLQVVELPIADALQREATWQQALAVLTSADTTGWAGQLATQFRLTPGQIWDAVVTAGNQWAMDGGQTPPTLPDLYRACRSHSNQRLVEMAIKIEPRYTWQDLILPVEKLAQLREICSQVRYRYQIFDEWGFDQKLAHGKGVSALFCGPPGTGKTMAAEVIAHDLQLDLFKIDLSSVVSKYIGETEKNLNQIFVEAETSNAILFFDEADALFGKRTEVSDAHDRYANIETSYLLQKMEEYEGVVILATNLRQNLDAAFSRRLRFIVEFPFPDAAGRREIWRAHFPAQAPVSQEIDYDFLARQLPLTGGSIRNIVLSAAFYAAENGGVINMEQIVRGSQREFEKIGRLWQELPAADHRRQSGSQTPEA
jgi:hypothetical protein